MRASNALLLAISLLGCNPSPDMAADAEKLMTLSRDWSSIAGSGNLDSALSYWAEDAVLMAPGLPPVRGKAAIRQFVEASSALPGFSIKWEPLEAHVAPSGDMAYLLERNSIAFKDSTGAPVTESNKVVTVWRKQPDGSWQNVVDMWNADPTAWR